MKTMEEDKKVNDKKMAMSVVIVAAIASFVTAFSGSALNLSIPSIGSEFDVSASSIGWMVTIYALSVAAFSVPWGRIADITSRRNVMVIGLGLFALGCLASVMATSFGMLLVMRLMQGIGASMVFSTNTAILISAFPPNKRGRAIGFNLGGVYVGLSSGPVLGGFLNHQLGWKSIFIFTVAMTVVSLILAEVFLPKDTALNKGRKLDVGGNILFIISIVVLMLGLSQTTVYGKWSLVMIAVGVALVIAFIIYENRQKDPALKVSLFKSNIGFGLSNLSAMLNYAATSALTYLVSVYLQVIMGYSSQVSGLIMICQPIIMAVLSPQMGKLSDTFSPFTLSSIGMAISAVGILPFIFIGRDTPVWVVVVSLVVTGLGFSLFSSPNTNAIMSCVEKADFGVASSLVSTMRTLGQTIGMVIVTMVVSLYMGGSSLAAGSTDMLVKVINRSFLIFVIICAVGVFLSFQRKAANKGKA